MTDTAFAVIDRANAQFTPKNARAASVRLKGLTQPDGIIVQVCQQPLSRWQTIEKGGQPFVATDLTNAHEETQTLPIAVARGTGLRSHATFARMVISPLVGF